MSTDICQIDFVNEKEVARIRAELPGEGILFGLADTFKVLGDPTRLRILCALAAGELCVCDLAALTEVSSSAVSHQLRLLRAAGLAQCRREGKMAYYTLRDGHVRTLLAKGLRLEEER